MPRTLSLLALLDTYLILVDGFTMTGYFDSEEDGSLHEESKNMTLYWDAEGHDAELTLPVDTLVEIQDNGTFFIARPTDPENIHVFTLYKRVTLDDLGFGGD
jgi:hypothetical protein